MRVFLIFLVILSLYCEQKKENDKVNSIGGLLAAEKKTTEIAPAQIPSVPANFDFATVKSNSIQISSITNTSSGFVNPYLSISIKEDFSDKVFSGFIDAGQTINLPIVIAESVDVLYYRVYTDMNTATNGILTRTSNGFTTNN